MLLTGKGKDLFLDFINAQSIIDAITAIEKFILGFRLGIRIGIGAMYGEDGVLKDFS